MFPAYHAYSTKRGASAPSAPSAPASYPKPQTFQDVLPYFHKPTTFTYVAFDIETTVNEGDSSNAPPHAAAPGIACIGLAYYVQQPQQPWAVTLRVEHIVPEDALSPIRRRDMQESLSEERGSAAQVARRLRHQVSKHAPPGPALSAAQVCKFVDCLHAFAAQQKRIVTWGGTRTDFRWLYAAVGDSAVHKRRILDLCSNHADIPFLTRSKHGVMMSLDATARAMGLNEKPAESANIPLLWRMKEERHLVVEHVRHDAVTTLHAAIGIALWHRVLWCRTNEDGSEETLQRSVPIHPPLSPYGPHLLLTMREALALPPPPYPLRGRYTPEFHVQWLMDARAPGVATLVKRDRMKPKEEESKQ